MSFVILTAYAPGTAVEGDAGAAQLPLLLNPTVEAVVDTEVPWNDHSPDLLLAWDDHDPDLATVTTDHTADTLAFSDHSAVTFALTDHTAAAVAFTDHTPD